jgi:hypothetical protein
MDKREFAVPPDVTVTLTGFRAALGPFPTIGEIVAVRFTAPENPLTLERVRAAVAEEPCERVMEVEFAPIVKSCGGGDATNKNACTERESFPLDPVIFIVKVPVGVEIGANTVSVELPVPVSSETEFGFAAPVMLVAAGGVAFRFTLPANPYVLESLIVNVATEPGLRVIEGGANAMLKSGVFEPVLRSP